ALPQRPACPAGGGGGVTGVEVTGQALLLPPHAGEGRGGAVSDARTCGAAVGLCPHLNPPPRAGGGVTGAEAAGQALLLPPHAGEGRDGGGVGREDLRRSGRTLPPPQPSPAGGGGGPRAWRRLGRPAPSPACGGRPGWGAASDARIRNEATAPCRLCVPPRDNTRRAMLGAIRTPPAPCTWSSCSSRSATTTAPPFRGRCSTRYAPS